MTSSSSDAQQGGLAMDNSVELAQVGETLEGVSRLLDCLIEKAQSGEVEPSELTALQAAVQHVCSVVDAMWGEESDAPLREISSLEAGEGCVSIGLTSAIAVCGG